MQMIPKDYLYLYQEPKSLCTPEVHAHLRKADMALNRSRLVHDKSSLSEQESLQVVGLISDSLACATVFLRNGAANSDAYDPLHSIIWAHFFMESQDVIHLVRDVDWDKDMVWAPTPMLSDAKSMVSLVSLLVTLTIAVEKCA